jgi:hypothetical protein
MVRFGGFALVLAAALTTGPLAHAAPPSAPAKSANPAATSSPTPAAAARPAEAAPTHAGPSASATTSPDAAARSRMRECGHQWSTIKKAGNAGTTTWKEFSATCLVSR